MATTAVAKVEKPPVGELSKAVVGLPSWGALSAASDGRAAGPSVDREYVPEWRWPTSVRTAELMGNDTQLAGLTRGTTLPIRRYVWGLDPNGAKPEVVDDVRREFNLELAADAWDSYQTGQSAPIPRARNGFSWDAHLADILKAPATGHAYFEKVGHIDPDGRWRLDKLAPIAPWTIGQIWVAENGDLISIRQSAGIVQKPLEATRLAAYVFDKSPGDWTGKSLFRPCWREWLSKDELLRIDVVNHAKAGGILLTGAPPGATAAEIEALGQLAAQAQIGGGGAMPAGSTPVFIRGTGSDIIGSINRHDEAMARVYLMMFMALGTASSGGNRALAGSFIDWFAIGQEAIAIWARDVFNEHVIRDYVDWNWGAAEEYLPRLSFRRPEAANPLDTLAQQVNQPAGDPGAVGYQTPDGNVVAVAAARFSRGSWSPVGQVVVSEEQREQINAAHAEWEVTARPKNGRTTTDLGRAQRPALAAATTVPLPDRQLRREPYTHEVAASVNFNLIDSNWQTHADTLVAQWQTIRAQQITELAQLIEATGGDLEALAQIQATAAGGDLIAAQLKAIAAAGASEAVGEAQRQGVAAALPDLATLEEQLAARSAALEQLLSRSLAEAAARRAVQLSGGALDPSQVASAVSDYLTGLTDTYLADQFGGALSAAQNAGRMAAMDENGATALYASELLDVNTCDPCAAVDGTSFASMDEAAAAYPAGGYAECLGGPRCRGTVVATYDEAAPSA